MYHPEVTHVQDFRNRHAAVLLELDYLLVGEEHPLVDLDSAHVGGRTFLDDVPGRKTHPDTFTPPDPVSGDDGTGTERGPAVAGNLADLRRVHVRIVAGDLDVPSRVHTEIEVFVKDSAGLVEGAFGEFRVKHQTDRGGYVADNNIIQPSDDVIRPTPVVEMPHPERPDTGGLLTVFTTVVIADITGEGLPLVIAATGIGHVAETVPSTFFPFSHIYETQIARGAVPVPCPGVVRVGEPAVRTINATDQESEYHRLVAVVLAPADDGVIANRHRLGKVAA